MKTYRLLAFFCALLLIFGFVAHRSKTPVPALTNEYAAILKTLFPEADSFSQKNAAPSHFLVLSKNQDLLGFIFLTSQLTPNIYGYGGRIELAIATDIQGTIRNIQVLKNNETPGFTKKFSNFLNAFLGKSPSDPLQLGEDIDGISGATITSSAVTRSIRTCLIQMRPLFKQSFSSQDTPNTKNALAALTSVFPIFVLFVLAIISANHKRGTLLWLPLILSFIYLGIFHHSMLATQQAAQIGLGIIPDFWDNPTWHALIIGLLVTSLLWGRVYCARICPFAFVEEILYAVRKKIWKRNFSLPIQTARFSRWIKYVLFLLLVVTALALQSAAALGVEAYLTLFTGQAEILSWALLICILLASLLYYRFWCRYLCPFGACAGLIASFRIKPKATEHAVQTDASYERLCLIQIPKQNSGSPYLIDHAECLHCGHCVRVCAAPPHKIKTPKLFVGFLTVSLILFTLSMLENIKEVKKNSSSDLLIIAADSSRTSSAINVEHIRQQIQDAGIKPYPAQFWKTTDE